MPSTSGSLIADLEAAVSGTDSLKRAETLRRVTDLFLATTEQFSDDQIALFDDVLTMLAADIEARSRVELAKRLAAVENAPFKVMQSLARDERSEIAVPVLEQSPRLSEETILHVAQTQGQDHLLAISQRREINEAATDLLISRGNQTVIRSVAGNNGARFSSSGLETLTSKAANDGDLAVRLSSRKDISPQQLRALFSKASQIVLDRLISECPGLEANIRQVVGHTADKHEANVQPGREYDAAIRQVDGLHATDTLTDLVICEFARSKKFEQTVVSLARLCDMPVDAVERCLLAEQTDLALILARAAGSSWTTAKAILDMRNPELQKVMGNVEATKKSFLKLQPMTAQRLVRFYRVRNSGPASPELFGT